MKAKLTIGLLLLYALLGVLLRFQTQKFRPNSVQNKGHATCRGMDAERKETKSSPMHLYGNSSTQKNVKVKRSKRRTCYYFNSTASFHVIIALRYDIEKNPGPKGPSLKCSTCSKTVRSNQKHLACEHCFTTTHVACLKQNSSKKVLSHQNFYTCVSCLHRTLPFFSYAGDLTCDDSSLSIPDHNFSDETFTDRHLVAFENKQKLLKVMHLNTQSLVSNFNQLNLKLSSYPFDVVALSETWLKENKLLLDYVNIPGYDLIYNNRETIRGGGVGFYVKQTLKYKRRKDIEEKSKDLEHVWMELPGHNKNSRLLVGVIYRSEKMLTFDDWLNKFEELLCFIKATWDGPIYLTGDTNTTYFVLQILTVNGI